MMGVCLWCVFRVVCMFHGVLVCGKSPPPWFWTCTGFYSLGRNTAPGRSTRSLRIDRVTIDRETREQSSFWPVDGDRPGLPLLPTGLDRPINPRAKMPKSLLNRSIDLQRHRPSRIDRVFWTPIFLPCLQLLLSDCYSNFSKTFAVSGRQPQPWLNTKYLLNMIKYLQNDEKTRVQLSIE